MYCHVCLFCLVRDIVSKLIENILPKCIALQVILPEKQIMICAVVIVYLEFVTMNLLRRGYQAQEHSLKHRHACIPSPKLSHYSQLLLKSIGYLLGQNVLP